MVVWMGNSEGMESGNRIAEPFLRDVLFWIALVAGPLICVFAAWCYGVAFDVARPLHEYTRFFILVIAYPFMEEIIFRGALQGRADKGPIITTGRFTRDARAEAQRDGAIAIDLLDGNELAEKLKDLRLGVSVEMVEDVSVNADWFDGI